MINENYIAIISISNFCGLDFESLDNLKSNDYFNISSQNDIDKLKVDFSKYKLIIITADLDGENSYNLISNFLKLIKNDLNLGFFNNYNNKFDFNNKFNSIIDLSGLEPYKISYILKLIPDILTMPALIGIDFKDIKKALNISKIFKPKVIEFSNNQINNEFLFDKVDLSKSDSYIFCVYGNNDFSMNEFNLISKELMDNTKNDSIPIIYNCIINPKGKNNYLVILCGENK
jgi:hypothetical protein